MDSYFPKTRRPIVLSSLKRPKPSTTPPRTPPKQPEQCRLPQPPPAPKKLLVPPARRRCVRNIFDDLNKPSTKQNTKQTIVDLEEPTTEKRVADDNIIATPIITIPTTPKKEIKVTPDSPKISKGPLKGVSTSLLDIIRAKEAAAKAISPEEERRRELLGIAPEVVRIVPTVFTSSKREILPYNKVVEKCHKGLKSNYTSATIIECLDLMEKVVPGWITTVTISRGKFMRINRQNHTIPILLETIKRYKHDLTDKSPPIDNNILKLLTKK